MGVVVHAGLRAIVLASLTACCCGVALSDIAARARGAAQAPISRSLADGAGHNGALRSGAKAALPDLDASSLDALGAVGAKVWPERQTEWKGKGRGGWQGGAAAGWQQVGWMHEVRSTTAIITTTTTTTTEDQDPDARTTIDVTRRTGKLCLKGKLLPQLYLLGAQKCGTSSLANDLMKVGIRSTQREGRHLKEWHFLDYEHTRQEWLDKLQGCDNKFTADYTPRNLALVPMPNGSRLMEWPPGSLLDYPLSCNRCVPESLDRFYGTAGVHRIVFVVMLREPLSRMLSSWYFYARQRRREGTNFSKELYDSTTMAQADPPVYTDWLWRSLYARQLEAYLEYVSPSQFVVIPMKRYYLNGSLVVNQILRKLNVSESVEFVGKSSQSNKNWHPPLDTILSPAHQEKFEQLMTPENEHLFLLLASMHEGGAHLSGFENSLHASVAEVRAWLTSYW